MKKKAAVLLAVSLAVMCAPGTVLADTNYTYGGTEGEDSISQDTELGSIDVKVQVKNDDVTHKYAVFLDTEEMTFVYKMGDGTWDPQTHTYDSSSQSPDWEEGSKTFGVENHSDLPVRVSLPQTISSSLSGVTVTAQFNGAVSETQLGAHPIGEAAEGDWKTTGTISLSGAPTGIDPADYATARTIATVTLTINSVSP